MNFFISPCFLPSSSFLFLAPCRNSLFYKVPIFWVTFIWVLQPVLKFGIIPNSQMGKLRPREKGLAKVTQFIRAKPGLEPWLFGFQFGVSGFPGGASGKECACNAGDLGSISRSGRSPGEGNSNPLQYSCLEIPWTEKPGELESMGSKRVGHEWACILLYYSGCQ